MSTGDLPPTPRCAADSAERMRATDLAAARREAMSTRARRIRRSVAAVASTFFVVAFLAVYVQLASGHDPSLTAAEARRAAAATLTASRSSESTSEAGAETPSSEGGDDSSSGEATTAAPTEESSSEGAQSTEEPAPVTTAQS